MQRIGNMREGTIYDAIEIANLKVDNWKKTYKNMFLNTYIKNMNYEKKLKNIEKNLTKEIFLYMKNKIRYWAIVIITENGGILLEKYLLYM